MPYTTRWRFDVGCISEVALRWARLVLGWVTQTNSTSYSQQLGKCVPARFADAVRLISKGRYDSFHCWMHVTCGWLSYLSAFEMNIPLHMNHYTNVQFTLLYLHLELVVFLLTSFSGVHVCVCVCVFCLLTACIYIYASYRY